MNADDVTRVTSTGMRHATGEGRTVMHALPVGYALDGVKGIRDPAAWWPGSSESTCRW